MAAPTLVEIILKKWGDDIAGAAKDLERIAGFPEPVAQRIATGELPMDPASIEARRIAQGYGDELYHGSTHNIFKFNGRGQDTNDWGQGTYLTDSTHDASTNYAGTHGPDFQAKIEMEERQADLEAGGEQFAREQAIARLQGDNDGVIYPLRVRNDNLLNTESEIPMPDYFEAAAKELGYEGQVIRGEAYDEIVQRADELEYLDLTPQSKTPNPNMPYYEVLRKYDGDMKMAYPLEAGDNWDQVRGKLTDQFLVDDEGEYVERGRAAAEIMQGWGAKGVVDPTTVERFLSMEPGTHTVIFPGNENLIRSVNAAYDPQYTGSNIMGGALAGAVGLGALSQSEDADASVASLAKRGLSVARERSHLNGSLFSVRTADGKEVAHADMGDDLNGGLSARYMEVEPEHRGSGLMNETYDAIEEISGKEITPSYWLTKDGIKFWVKRNRSLIDELYNNGEFSWDQPTEDAVGQALQDSLLGPVR